MQWARSDMVRLDSLGRFHGMRREVPPPPRLAQRTCEYLFDPRKRLRDRPPAAADDSRTRRSALPQPLELVRRWRGRRDLCDRGPPGPSGGQR